jgi:hypothetical protein
MFTMFPVCSWLYIRVDEGHVYFREVLAGSPDDGFNVGVMAMCGGIAFGGGLDPVLVLLPWLL